MPRGWFEQARQDRKQRGLAGAVGTEQSEHFAFAQLKAHAAESNRIAIAFVQIAHFKKCRLHQNMAFAWGKRTYPGMIANQPVQRVKALPIQRPRENGESFPEKRPSYWAHDSVIRSKCGTRITRRVSAGR